MGAGSFGTAVALVLERAGLRTTLLCRTAEQAERLTADRENERYLPGVRLPERLKVRTLGGRDDQFHRSDLVLVAVPSHGIDAAISELTRQGVTPNAGVVSLAKGLVPRTALRRRWRSGGRSAPTVSRASAGPPTHARWSTGVPG